MEIKERAKNLVGVRMVKAKETMGTEQGTRPVSQQIIDPFSEAYSTDYLIEPPYNPDVLVQLPEYSNVLQPLIDAYKTNITGFGYSFGYLVDMDSEEVEAEIITRAKKEWQALEFFYDYCNYDKTFTEITKLMIMDRETIGWGALEIIPKGNGKPGGVEYLPAHTLRLSRLDSQPQRIPIDTIDVDGGKVTVTYVKKFRRFCQLFEGEKVWFKEFGDPRKLDKITGQFEYQLEKGATVPIDRQATSVMYFPLSVSYSPYGIPRWMGAFLSIIGSRKSEELNYYYFVQGKHVPMAILVNNGSLTESSITKLEEYSTNIKGVENAHGFLIIEADSGEEEEFEDKLGKAPISIKLQPLTQALQHDGLFQEYDKNNRDKVRAHMKLPPIYTGESKDYTRATADTARSIAEEQIFNPERQEIAEKFNKLINPALDIRYASLYFKGPDLSNKLTLSQALNPYIKAGALTPNMLIKQVSDLLGVDFEQIKEDWANKPLALAIAEVSKGTKVPPAKQTEGTPTVVDDSAGGKVNAQ
jgi:PBSX family phage portal protein